MSLPAADGDRIAFAADRGPDFASRLRGSAGAASPDAVTAAGMRVDRVG